MSANGKAAVQIQPGNFRLVPEADIHKKRLTIARGTREAVFDDGWLAHRHRHIEIVFLR